MYHEVCMAILPSHSLAETFWDWDDIAEQLAEPNRQRSRYIHSITEYTLIHLGFTSGIQFPAAFQKVRS